MSVQPTAHNERVLRSYRMGGDGREISTWLSLERKKKNILHYSSSHQDIFIAKRRVDDDMAPSPHEIGSERTITTPSVSSSSSSKSLDGLSSEQAKKDGDSEHAHLPQPEKDVETAAAAAASSVHSPSRLVGWSGQDQQNPQNFTVVQKVSISVVISLMNLTVSLAVSVFSAMLEVVAAEFKQDRPEKMESTLTAYILGLAFGRCLLLAPFFLSIRGKRIVS